MLAALLSYNSLLSICKRKHKHTIGNGASNAYNSLLSICGMVPFWVRMVPGMAVLFMFVGTTTIPVHQAL